MEVQLAQQLDANIYPARANNAIVMAELNVQTLPYIAEHVWTSYMVDHNFFFLQFSCAFSLDSLLLDVFLLVWNLLLTTIQVLWEIDGDVGGKENPSAVQVQGVVRGISGVIHQCKFC